METRKVAAGDKVWIIEEDSTWTPGTYVRASMMGLAVIDPDDGERRFWYKRNVIDHETGERMA